MNSLPRSLLAALAAAMLVPLVGGVWFCRVQELRLRHNAEEQLQAVVQLKVDQVAAWRAERLADAAVLMESPFLAQAVDRFFAEPQADTVEQMRVRLRSLQKHYHYYDALLVDVEGEVRLSLSERPGTHRAAAQTLAAALRNRKPGITDLQIEADDPTPHVSVVAPLFVGDGDSRRPLGAVLLVCDARRFLYPLIRSWPTPSKTAETLLVRRDGDDVLFLNDLRDRPDTAFKLRVPLARTDVPAVRAVLGREGVVEGSDVRGVEVVSASKAVPDSPWFVVGQMDATEVSAAWRLQAVLILVATLAVVAAAAAIVLMVWHRNAKAHYQAMYHAEAALRESEANFRSIYEESPIGIELYDPHGTLLDANRASLAMFGVADLAAVKDFRLWEEPNLPADQKERLRRGENVRCELPYDFEKVKAARLYETTKSGISYLDVRITCLGCGLPDAMVGFLVQVSDITDRKRAELAVERLNAELEQRVRERTAQLAKSEEQLRLMVEHVVDYAIMSLDVEGRVVSWNIGAERITGYQPAEILGQSIARYYVPEDQAAGKLAGVLRRAETQSRVSDEGWRVRKDGSRFWAEVVVTPIRDEDDQLRGFSVVTRDVTERKRAETMLRESERRQAEAEKLAATGRMAARVAHEINNPLAGIKNSFRLLRDVVPDDHPDRDMVERIDREIDRIANIVREMYTLYSPRAKEMTDAVVADATRDVLLMLEPHCREHDVRVEASRIRPGVTVRIPEGGLHQTLYNLVTNAVDASPRGSRVSLAADVVRDQDGADWVEIAVRDHGSGILPEFQDRIFEPFFTSKTDDGTRGGLGMGLSVVKSIVEAAGGRIEFESTPGQGAVFRVFLCRSPQA